MNSSQDKWSTLSQVKSTIIKKWNGGIFLRDFIEPKDIFPLRIALHGPGPNDLSNHFELAGVHTV